MKQVTVTAELRLGLGSELVFGLGLGLGLGLWLGSGWSEKVSWDEMLWNEKSHTRSWLIRSFNEPQKGITATILWLLFTGESRK